MSDPVSVMNGAVFEGAVKVKELGLVGMITLRGDLGSEVLTAAVKSAVSLGLPDVRKVKNGKGGLVIWMSTDELLLVVDYVKADAITAKLSKALAGQHHMAVNVSDARASFRLSGVGAREVIAKGAPVDMSQEVFGKREVRRSRVGQIAAAFWTLDGESFDLVCFRSVGEFMFDWLSNAAREGSLPEYY